jgi:hypothetical protein
MLAQFAAVLLVRETPDKLDGDGNSPMLPALALLLVVVPTMPDVWDGVMAPEAAIVVKLAGASPDASKL